LKQPTQRHTNIPKFASMVIGYRHCDPRFPFLWQSRTQAAARWHGPDEGPANYFADTPTGAWAEFLRHEGITDEADLAGVRRSLWAVEIPDATINKAAQPKLPGTSLFGDEKTYPICQAAARKLRAAGATALRTRGAALLPGEARGWLASAGVSRDSKPRHGMVWVHFGVCAFVGWVVVEAGAPPAAVLPMVRVL
jgi:RES domain